jgi:phosphoenolpyruvate synthase/pyruvate phosphate dikinase
MYTKTFNQINRNDVMEAGGKGAFLGELTRNGIIVPPGFVILTQAFERFLANIEESLQLEENELSYYNKEEIVIILQTGIRINPKLLAERKLEFAMSFHNGILTLMEGNAAKRWIEVNNEKIVRGLHEVKGLAAYRGRITGKARIVMNVKDQNNVMEGDILIVPMTTPDFMPGLLKAAAFVTDEGGVICHAAIVARELKKPCVIGTKKATTVFRNGDMVEVDGFSGIVRLITHSA